MQVSMSAARSGPFGAFAHWLGGVVLPVCLLWWKKESPYCQEFIPVCSH